MKLADAFDEWLRRYIEEPERFEREFQTIVTFIEEDADGSPTYGKECAAYLRKLMREKRRPIVRPVLHSSPKTLKKGRR